MCGDDVNRESLKKQLDEVNAARHAQAEEIAALKQAAKASAAQQTAVDDLAQQVRDEQARNDSLEHELEEALALVNASSEEAQGYGLAIPRSMAPSANLLCAT